MAGKLVVSTLSTGATEIGLDDLTANKVRAWVSFKGNDTVAIVRSFNVSSIVDHGVGNYQVNFTAAMPHGDYVPSVMAKEYDNTNGSTVLGTFPHTSIADTYKATALRIATKSGSNWYDCARVNVLVAC